MSSSSLVRIASLNSCSKQFVEQACIHYGAVVALHELLDRQGVGGVLVAEQLCELQLMIKQQPVLAPTGHDVQAETHLPQEGLRLFEAAQFARGDKAAPRQAIERLRAEMALRHPAYGLQVAQGRRDRS